MKIMTIQYQPRTTSRRGIATMLAIILMAILVGTVSAMTLVFAAQTKRTQAASAGAQLRQLLSAAIPFAQQELATHTPPPPSPSPDLSITTPVPESTLTLHFTTSSPTETQVRVTATWRNFKAIQTLTLTRPTNPTQSWPLQSATLVQSP